MAGRDLPVPANIVVFLHADGHLVSGRYPMNPSANENDTWWETDRSPLTNQAPSPLQTPNAASPVTSPTAVAMASEIAIGAIRTEGAHRLCHGRSSDGAWIGSATSSRSDSSAIGPVLSRRGAATEPTTGCNGTRTDPPSVTDPGISSSMAVERAVRSPRIAVAH